MKTLRLSLILLPVAAALTPKEEENKAAFEKFNDEFKKILTNPDWHKDVYLEGAGMSLNGADFIPHKEAYDPFFAHAVKFDYEWEFNFVTDTHVGGTCIDYIEYDNGCGTMFVAHSVATMKDGKIAEMRTYLDSENMAKLEACMPKEDKPTTKLE